MCSLTLRELRLPAEFSLNPFPPDSAKSKIDNFPKITNWVKLKTNSTTVLLNSFPMNGHTFWSVLSIESKVGKLCITKALTLGVKGLSTLYVQLQKTDCNNKIYSFLYKFPDSKAFQYYKNFIRLLKNCFVFLFRKIKRVVK